MEPATIAVVALGVGAVGLAGTSNCVKRTCQQVTQIAPLAVDQCAGKDSERGLALQEEHRSLRSQKPLAFTAAGGKRTAFAKLEQGCLFLGTQEAVTEPVLLLGDDFSVQPGPDQFSVVVEPVAKAPRGCSLTFESSEEREAWLAEMRKAAGQAASKRVAELVDRGNRQARLIRDLEDGKKMMMGERIERKKVMEKQEVNEDFLRFHAGEMDELLKQLETLTKIVEDYQASSHDLVEASKSNLETDEVIKQRLEMAQSQKVELQSGADAASPSQDRAAELAQKLKAKEQQARQLEETLSRKEQQISEIQRSQETVRERDLRIKDLEAKLKQQEELAAAKDAELLAQKQQRELATAEKANQLVVDTQHIYRKPKTPTPETKASTFGASESPAPSPDAAANGSRREEEEPKRPKPPPKPRSGPEEELKRPKPKPEEEPKRLVQKEVEESNSENYNEEKLRMIDNLSGRTGKSREEVINACEADDWHGSRAFKRLQGLQPSPGSSTRSLRTR